MSKEDGEGKKSTQRGKEIDSAGDSGPCGTIAKTIALQRFFVVSEQKHRCFIAVSLGTRTL